MPNRAITEAASGDHLTKLQQVKFEINESALVEIFGAQDSLLRTVEAQYPKLNILLRSNEITLTGSASQAFD